jgi:hypothetical protein
MLCLNSFSVFEAKAPKPNVQSPVFMAWVKSGREFLTFRPPTRSKLSQRFSTKCLGKKKRRRSSMNSCIFQVDFQVVSDLTKATLNGKSWSSSTRNCCRQGLQGNPRLVYKLIFEMVVKVFKGQKRLKSESAYKHEKVKKLWRCNPTRSERIDK